MNKKFATFGHIEIEKENFYHSKHSININDLDVD